MPRTLLVGESVLDGCHLGLHAHHQENFADACGDVVAVVREHGDGDNCGFHGQLRAVGLDPKHTIDVAEQIVSGLGGLATTELARIHGGLAFIAGMLVGVQLGRGEAAHHA